MVGGGEGWQLSVGIQLITVNGAGPLGASAFLKEIA